MPATRTKAKKEKDETTVPSTSKVVAFVYGSRKIALPRPPTYEDAVALAQKHCIPEPVPDFCVVIKARIPSSPELGLLELNSDVWPIISHEIKEFEIGYHEFVDNGPVERVS
ncbi:hypothetical protein FRC00_000952 [Tulasnella sp. 408]|nr:hypothetical protein FRC00_000952 [Tulasnella sp. 408]